MDNNLYFKSNEEYQKEIFYTFTKNRAYFESRLLHLIKTANKDFGTSPLEYLENALRLTDHGISNAKTDKVGNSLYPFGELSFSDGFEIQYISLDELKELKTALINVKNRVIDSKGSNLDSLEDILSYPKDIFKNEIAYSLFLTYVDEFKDDKNYKAVFSFFFNAMTTVGQIHCSGVNFATYLADYDIPIDKIDSNQTYQKNDQKYLLFKYKYKVVYGHFPKK